MKKIKISVVAPELSGIFSIDLHSFAEFSREVGYANCKANRKNSNDKYDNDAIKEYEALRMKQLNWQEALTNFYKDKIK